jgi:hypothetical protein
MLIMILLIGYYGKLMAIFLIPIGFSFCHAFVTLGLYTVRETSPLPGPPRIRGGNGWGSERRTGVRTKEHDMIKIFELRRPESVPPERFFELVQRARRIAVEIEGVYDLALYQTEEDGLWQCSVDVEDAQAWEELQADPRFRGVLQEMEALGVSIVSKSQWERRV